MTNARVRFVSMGLAAALLATSVGAAAQPYPPYPPYPPPPPPRRSVPPPPPPRYYPPPRAVDPTPPPLSPVMRVIYAPFYAAGLVVRYGFYYVFVAPIEVFARTVNEHLERTTPRPPKKPFTPCLARSRPAPNLPAS